MRKAVGVGAILIGLVWLFLPFTPGLLLIVIGFELLGFDIILLDRIEKRLTVLRRFRRQKN